ncbi:MAG: VWA domain-containing protein [Nitrosopumilus sp.]|uniref:vWA domain-containing protein n=1 Tax=Nitrosopumilus sp. TaxID=2024843 RepID=UPI00247BC4E0|nr:vWA domain-containing protein [Nitrosopumilus sp.]MCV0392263.1 VWA domain-containing protein [Nitrosopumilus sp.]
MASQIFFDICEKKPIDVDVFFSDKIYFPKIEYEPRTTVYFPIPREVKGMQIIQNSIFSNLEKYQDSIFALFFASVCHLAGHVKVTDFKIYKEWMSGKNKPRAYETIEFIEDIRVNDFLKNHFPEYYSEIIKIQEVFDIINEKYESEDFRKLAEKTFVRKYLQNMAKEKEAIIKRITSLEPKNPEKFLEIADIVYKSLNKIEFQKYPFTDHYSHPEKISKWYQNQSIQTEGRFEDIVKRFEEIWFVQIKQRAKMNKKYDKIVEGLEFDKIDFAPENIGEYLRLKNATHMFLKKMSNQMKMVTNIQDEGVADDMGLLEMQAAIQSVASENPSIQIFEQDDVRKVEEAWSIIVDTSSSMKLKFNEMKKFTMCLGEAAHAVNAKNGKWGFFTFNNNFTIIKDHDQNFDQSAKARVGGIEINGLSFIADAVKLSMRILEKEIIERKYIFLVTDGQALGTIDADSKMRSAVEEARKKGINIVAIGIQDGNTKIFSRCIPYEGLRKTIAKFLNAYQLLSEDGI